MISTFECNSFASDRRQSGLQAPRILPRRQLHRETGRSFAHHEQPRCAAPCHCPATNTGPPMPPAYSRQSARRSELCFVGPRLQRECCVSDITLVPQAQHPPTVRRSAANPTERQRMRGGQGSRQANERLTACAAAAEHSYGSGTGSAVAEPPQDGLLFSRGSPGCVGTQTCNSSSSTGLKFLRSE